MSFYQTQLKSVGNGAAVDVEGKHLTFIGDYPCQAGDTVWTDGKIIFGHVPIRGTALTTPELGGIPVLADKLRGYFDKNGMFKKYSIAEDDWITNDKRLFRHGEVDVDAKKIIDAEVSTTGKLLTVTDGIFRKNQYVKYDNHMYIQRTYGIDENMETYQVFHSVNGFLSEEITLGVDDEDRDTDIVFYENNIPTQNVNLKQYADLAAELALSVKDKIMQQSDSETPVVNWTNQPPPPEDFIAVSTAKVATMHLHKNGDWDAVIISSAYGYCFPYVVFDASIFLASFPPNAFSTFHTYQEAKPFIWALETCLANFEYVVYEEKKLPVTFNAEKYQEFPGNKTLIWDWYHVYLVKAADYYMQRAKFKYRRWFPMMFNACKIIKVHNGEVTDTIYSKAGGGHSLNLDKYSWDARTVYYRQSDDFIVEEPEVNNSWQFPLDENYFFKANGLKLEAVYNSKGEKIVDIPAEISSDFNKNFFEAYFLYPMETDSKLDRNANWLAENQQVELSEIWGAIISTPKLHYKKISNDGVQELWDWTPPNNDFLSGWFKENAEDLRINHCFTKLKNSEYLLGTYEGDLFKFKTNDETEKVDSNLKNFRLRELKKVTNAKK